MNKRRYKKALKKAGAVAIVNHNEHLIHENVKLRREIAVAIKGLNEVGLSFNANMGALARLYGEKIEGYSVIKVPIDEIRTVLNDYDVKCSIEGDKYVICVLPKVDPEAE